MFIQKTETALSQTEKPVIGAAEARVFAQNMRRQRARKHMFQNQLAEASGLDLATINQIENLGLTTDRDPRLSSLVAIARALETTLLDMFTGTVSAGSDPPEYLTYSDWFWSKLRYSLEDVNGGLLDLDEPRLRRAFDGFLAVVKPEKEFEQSERESIWNDRYRVLNQWRK
jgi:transcriptional regulator with XRE-family HTH domain